MELFITQTFFNHLKPLQINVITLIRKADFQQKRLLYINLNKFRAFSNTYYSFYFVRISRLFQRISTIVTKKFLFN